MFRSPSGAAMNPLPNNIKAGTFEDQVEVDSIILNEDEQAQETLVGKEKSFAQQHMTTAANKSHFLATSAASNYSSNFDEFQLSKSGTCTRAGAASTSASGAGPRPGGIFNMGGLLLGSKQFRDKWSSKLSNFSIQYNLGCATLAIAIMQTHSDVIADSENPPDFPVLTKTEKTLTLAMIFVGNVVGMLSMGYLGDLLGVPKAIVCTTGISIFGQAGVAFFTTGEWIYEIFILFRFVLGIGVGGLYPLSAKQAALEARKAAASSSSSPSSASADQASKVGWNFFWQQPGNCAPYLVGLCLFAVSTNTGFQFRCLVALGIVPLALVFMWNVEKVREEEYSLSQQDPYRTGYQPGLENTYRLRSNSASTTAASTSSANNSASEATLPEIELRADLDQDVDPFEVSTNNSGLGTRTETSSSTSASSASIMINAGGGGGGPTSAGGSASSSSSLHNGAASRRNTMSAPGGAPLQQMFTPYNKETLLGTGGTWFLFDVAYYGTQIFSPFILQQIFVQKSLQSNCLQALVSACFQIPGTIAGIYYLQNYVDVKQLNAHGFLLMGLVFGLLAVGKSYELPSESLFFLYCLLQFTLGFGCILATYILPTVVFDKSVQSTMHGISAGLGKAGAAVGAFLFPIVSNSLPSHVANQTLMSIQALVCCAGFLVNQWYVPDIAAVTELLLREEEEGLSRVSSPASSGAMLNANNTSGSAGAGSTLTYPQVYGHHQQRHALSSAGLSPVETVADRELQKLKIRGAE
ncbi:unnamed protein product [Amoebophrya sp. A120]|nr:unnamed protein product [Amoebophrya sp. A120]|eukprot:GSA120T00024351001.1